MKTIFIVLDGAGDRPCRELNNKTPYEAAKKPNLDFLAKNGICGLCQTVGKGIAPESDVAVTAILGYDPYRYFTGRGPLEAYGAGVKLGNGFLALRANFASMEGYRILDRRTGRSLTTNEAKALADSINKKVKLPCKFMFKSTTEHRGVLVLYGKFSDKITNVDPAYEKQGTFGVAKAFANEIQECQPLGREAEETASIINEFVEKSRKVLENDPVNIARGKKGILQANAILVRDAGNRLPEFPKKKGWAAIVGMPLEIGIAELAGMKILKVNYPEIKAIDVYKHLYDCLNAEIRDSLKYLKSDWNRFNAFYIHIKETDIPGHDGKPLEKKKMIELIDKKLFSAIRKLDARIIVTSDHSTPCQLKAHSADPVPLLVFDGKSKDNLASFTERECRRGSLGTILGKDIWAKI
ncbi:MAG TPA: 2,3-bisphosphoglycerate-independent phosphoglycerate mutase [Nanoarchaeota archaeon]|nr:2,3-bisphosphoglycerate-independent phosphoglycerate mutase [Nanoarchaeota archaeon]